MSYYSTLNKIVNKFINLNNNPTINGFRNNANVATLYATKIQRCIKNRDVRVATKICRTPLKNNLIVIH